MASSRDVDDQTAEWSKPDARSLACRPTSREMPPQRTAPQITSNVLERLARTVEAEIIPRLLLAHTPDKEARPAAARCREAPTGSEIEDFARLLLQRDADDGLAFARRFTDGGVPVEDLMLGLLAPAARLLGEYWKEDTCDFTEVTVALARLQHILRDLKPLHGADHDGLPACHPQRRMVFLVAAPGEQHSFGLTVVEEFFRRNEWDVWGGVALSRKKIVEMVRANHFDVIGFSLSCERFLAELTATIRAVRKASHNPSLIVMVGGPFFIEHPECVERIGADATAADGQQAADCAQRLIQKLDHQALFQPERS